MRENVLIEVSSSLFEDNEKKEFQITTNAEYKGEDNDYTILYSDTDEDMKECTTLLHVENGNLITIHRQGEALSHLVLEKSRRHISQHETPFGMFTMGISTDDIRSAVHNGKGTLYFRYTTDVDMMPVNIMEFNIKLLSKEKADVKYSH